MQNRSEQIEWLCNELTSLSYGMGDPTLLQINAAIANVLLMALDGTLAQTSASLDDLAELILKARGLK